MLLKILKIIVFSVGTYVILSFLVRLYKARQKMNSREPEEKKPAPTTKKPMINPEAGEYTDYEEVKD
jgi:hypothetical protein